MTWKEQIRNCIGLINAEGHSKPVVAKFLRGLANELEKLQLFAEDELPTQGAKAGQSGNSLELMFEALFTARGVRVAKDNPEFHYANFWDRKEKLLIRQVQKDGSKMDYLYKNFRAKLSLPIELKQQQVGGTTDEKLGMTVDRLIAWTKSIECSGYWLVLNGDGFRPGITRDIQTKIIATNARERLRGRLLHFAAAQKNVDALIHRGEF